ncbi:MAG: hypothetical protein JW904_00250 [Spirochaetales bacterium]|nr:hypothetical protein [Spirochaetales bacterium]
MRQIIMRSIFLIFMILAACGMVFAQKLVTFENGEHQYSLQYPESWFLADDEDFELYTSKDIEDRKTDGAVFTVQVSELEMDDLKNRENIFSRVMKDMNGDIQLGDLSSKYFAGTEWEAASFSVEDLYIAKAYCTVKNLKIYIIAVGYIDAASETKYSGEINSMLESFVISPIVFETIQNDELGITFQYPQHWEFQEESGMGYTITTDESASSTEDIMAGIAIGVMPAGTLGGSEEEIVKQISGSSNKIIYGPEKRDIGGMSWTYLEVTEGPNKGTIAVRATKEKLWLIVTIVNPVELEPDMEEIFMTFFNSLQFAE